jgi:hypothetical protein
MIPGAAFVVFGAIAAGKWLSKCGAEPLPPCVQISDRCIKISNEQPAEDVDKILKHAVIVDFGQRMLAWKNRAKGYRDLSPTGDADSAVRFVNSLIEWAHSVPGVVLVFLPSDIIQDKGNNSDRFLTTIQQRFRAETGGAKPIQNLLDISIQFPNSEELSTH